MYPPKQFETKRLHLRKPLLSDAVPIFDQYAQNDEVTKYLTWQPHKNLKETKNHLELPDKWHTPQQQPRQPQTTTTADGREKFLVKEIVAQVTPNGNLYYAVKGAQYMKYGVTAWPEVAEQQVNSLLPDVLLEELNTTESWSAAGRNLFALAEKPEGEKFAQKVVEFVVG